MFGFRRKEKNREELLVVVDGTLIPIENVRNPIFSQKMVGDGFAITSAGDIICACTSADITMLFPNNHVVGLILENGMEILIHVGIGMVSGNGNGFTCLYRQEKHVKRGGPLLRMDREYLLSEGYDLGVTVIFTNKDNYTEFHREESVEVRGRESATITYILP